MTVFTGAFQHPDMFHRIATIFVTTSIVVTAVYILRVVGILLLGPLKNDHFAHLDDARWYERLSAGTLVIAIAGIGIAPLWLSNLISGSLAPYVARLTGAVAGLNF